MKLQENFTQFVIKHINLNKTREEFTEILFPSNSFREDLMESMTNEQYENLRVVIKSICKSYNEAYSSQDKKESIDKYRFIFGNKFPEEVLIDIYLEMENYA